MEKLLIANLGSDVLSESLETAETQYNWPVIPQGDTLALTLRLAEKVGGEYVEAERTIKSVRVKLGIPHAIAESGDFKLLVGDPSEPAVEGTNLTTWLSSSESAEDLETALNALTIVGTTYGAASVTAKDGSWFAVFDGETEEVPIQRGGNRLVPRSGVKVYATELDDVWTHEIRLAQAGVAFEDDSSTVLPAAPQVEKFREGATADGDKINEIQRVKFNPAFRGIYEIRWKDRVSAPLDKEDGPVEFGNALAGIADEDGEFIVTNPSANIGYVEFAEEMGGQIQDLLEVAVIDNPPGDIRLCLTVNNGEVANALRSTLVDHQKEFSLEIEIRYEDPFDETKTLPWTYSQPVNVRREQIDEGEATVHQLDRLRPVDTTTYVLFDPSQISNGQDFYPFSIGGSGAGPYTLDHDLHTKNVGISLKENLPAGNFLNPGIDFRVQFDPEGSGEDSLTITLLGDYATNPPDAGGLFGEVVSRETTSVFDGHFHPISNILLLQDKLDSIFARLTAVEAAIPKGIATKAAGSDAESLVIVPAFNPVWYVGPTRDPIERSGSGLLGDIDPLEIDPFGLGKIRSRLLRAVHQAGVPGDLLVTKGRPDTGLMTVNTVYKAAEVVKITRGPRGRSINLQIGEFCVYNGQDVYQVSKLDDATTTYYPTDFEIPLFEFDVNEKQLRAKTTLTAGFEFELGMFLRGDQESHARAQWMLRVELAEWTSEANPATTGTNLKKKEWDTASPILEHRFLVGPQVQRHGFGFAVERKSDGETFDLESSLYGSAEVSAAALTTGNASFRGYLTGFDLEDAQTGPVNLTTPTGLVGLSGLRFQDSGDGVGSAVIK